MKANKCQQSHQGLLYNSAAQQRYYIGDPESYTASKLASRALCPDCIVFRCTHDCTYDI